VANKLVAGFSWNFILMATTHTLNLLRTVIVARILVPEDFGLLGMAMAVIVGISVFGDFSFKNALIVHEQHSDKEQKNWLNTIWTAGLFVNLVLTILLILAAFPASVFFNDERVAWIILVLSITPLISAFANPELAIFEKNMAYQRIAVLEILKAFIGTVIVIIAAWILKTVWALVIGFIAGSLIGTGLSYFLFKYRPSFEIDRDILKQTLGFSKHILAVSVMTYVTTQFDNLVIGTIMGATLLGLYLLAYRLTEYPVLFLSGVTRVLLPHYASIGTDLNKFRDAWMRVYRIMLWGALLFYIPLMLFPTWIITIILGEQWGIAGEFLGILAFAGLLRILARSVTPALLALKRPDIDAQSKLIEVIIFIPGILIAVHTGDLKIVSWVVVFTYLVALALRLYAINRELNIPMSFFTELIFHGLLITSVTGGAAYISMLVTGKEIISIILALLIFIFFAFLFLPDFRIFMHSRLKQQ